MNRVCSTQWIHLAGSDRIVTVASRADVLAVANLARRVAWSCGAPTRFGSELATAVAELAQNTLDHGGGVGEVSIERIESGVRVVVLDAGCGAGEVLPCFAPQGRGGPAHRRGLGQGCRAVGRLMDVVSARRNGVAGLRIEAIKWMERPC